MTGLLARDDVRADADAGTAMRRSCGRVTGFWVRGSIFLVVGRLKAIRDVSGGRKTACYVKCMQTVRELKSLSDDRLLASLTVAITRSRCATAEVVAHIAEVDARRLYAREACSSMFVYCVERLRMSEHEAYLRINVARATREHPVLLEMIADGRLNLSGVCELAKHLTAANRDDVLARATGKTKRQIQELVAELAPKPDVPDRIRKLPSPAKVGALELGLDRVANQVRVSVPVAAPAPKSKVAPLAPARYKIEFTASAALRDKLDRLRGELRSQVPGGDLAALIEIAVTEKLERIEKRRYAKSDKPRQSVDESNTSPKSRYIPAPIRRAVRERDGDQCTFVDNEGRRCSERARLEFDHVQSYGKQGDHDPANLRLRCRAHNLMHAEQDYGADKLRRYRSRAKEADVPYGRVYGQVKSMSAAGMHAPATSCSAPPMPSPIGRHFSSKAQPVWATMLHGESRAVSVPRLPLSPQKQM